MEKVPIPAAPVHPRPPLAVKSISEPASLSGQASMDGENQNQEPRTKNQPDDQSQSFDRLLKLGLVLQVSCLLQIVLRVLSYPITLNRVVRLLVDNFGGRCSIDPGPRLARTAVKHTYIYIYIYRLRWISRLTSDQIPSSPN